MTRDKDIITYSLNFVEGEIMGMYVSTSLETIYKNLFVNAKRAAKRKPTDVTHGIKIVIFGCFMLEAKSNSVLENILRLDIQTEQLSGATWEVLKRTNILKKIELICVAGNNTHLQKIDGIKGQLENVFNLRNRLAHYKNEKEQIASKISHIEAKNIFSEFPVPKLSQQLSWESTSKFAEIISQANNLLSNVDNWVSQKNGIRNTIEKINL